MKTDINDANDSKDAKLTTRFWIILGGIVLMLAILLPTLLIPADETGDASPTLPAEPSFDVPAGIEAEIQSPQPSATTKSSPTPKPTEYRLPLVPNLESSPTPTATDDRDAELDREQDNTPRAELSVPRGDFELIEGEYSSECKDILVIATSNSNAIGLVLMRIKDGTVKMIALPCELSGKVYRLNDKCEAEAVVFTELKNAPGLGGTKKIHRYWNTLWAVKNLVGIKASHYIYAELGAVSAMLDILKQSSRESVSFNAEDVLVPMELVGQERAECIVKLGRALFASLSDFALWDLPEMQRVSKGKMGSSLSVNQLLSLAAELKGLTLGDYWVLPTVDFEGITYLDYEASIKIITNLYK